MNSIFIKAPGGGGIGTGRRFKQLIFHLGHADSPAPASGINGHSEDMNQDSVPKASLRLGFSEYCRISNLIVLHLRKMEEGEAIPSAAPVLSHLHKLYSHKLLWFAKDCVVLSEEMINF